MEDLRTPQLKKSRFWQVKVFTAATFSHIIVPLGIWTSNLGFRIQAQGDDGNGRCDSLGLRSIYRICAVGYGPTS